MSERTVQALTEQVNQYRTLENELSAAVEAIARIKESALQLDAEDEVNQALVAACGVDQDPQPNTEQEPETVAPTAIQDPQPITEQEARASIFPPVQMPLSIEVGDLVECPSGKVGHVTYKCVIQDKEMATVIAPGGASNYHVKSLVYLGKYKFEEPQAEVAQRIIPASNVTWSEIQSAARQLYEMKDWMQIRRILQKFAPSTKVQIFRELPKEAVGKIKVKFLESLPVLIARYCEDSGDRTDLEWLPQTLRQKVEELLGHAAA